MDLTINETVPKEDYEYYIVERQYREDPDIYNLSKYKKGDKILLDLKDLKKDFRPKLYIETYQRFIENYCRKASEKEANKMYDKMFSNARIHKDYGLLTVFLYYLPKNDTKAFNFENKYKFMEDTGISVNDKFEIINNGQFIIKELKSDNCIIKVEEDNYKYWRKAKPKETLECCKEYLIYLKKQQEDYKHRIEENRRKAEQRYWENRDNPAYFPGACGEFKQVITDRNYNPIVEELYDYHTVKKFYELLINSGKISKHLLEKILLYGGTVPYLLANAKEAPRKFGDIDIFIPIQHMDEFREALKYKNYFKMLYDSKSLTQSIPLTACRDTYKLQKSRPVYQDYGFKGKLFGMNISVFPIYQWEKKPYHSNEKTFDILSKNFRIGKNPTDNKFLLNTTIINNTDINSFKKIVELYGGTIGIVPIEYTIASKESAIIRGYKKREDKDMIDLSFIEENRKILNIDENLVEHYKNNMPDNGIQLVYRIKKNNETDIMDPLRYRNFVTQNRDFPS